MKIAKGLIIGLLLLISPGLALAAGENIRFESLAQIEVAKVNARGEKVMERQPASLVVPGTVVIYTNSYTNIGNQPAERLAVTNPVPAGMEYLGGSATGKDAAVTYSIDNGKSFDTPDKLFVVEKDGKRRPAEAKEYTHIRWTLDRPLPPGGKGSVEYRAKLK